MKRCPTCQAACLDTHRHCASCGSDLSAVESEDGDPFLGTTLVGKYQLLELIGVGAMGRVYRALHLGLDTQVAVKLLNSDIASDPISAKRFQNEARASSRLHHPNAIAILDFGQAASGTLYLVMELLRGRTLAQLVRDEGPLPPARLSDLLGQALAALDEAHEAGIIHRDFKPENIFIETLRSGREHVKVLDFGIAKLRGETDAALTSAGLVCGTPDYMSPEQIRGLELDPRSDVYAAGVVMYEALTGRRLHEGVTALIDVLQAHLNLTPAPFLQRRPDLQISPLVEKVCMRALSKDVALRYASASELRTALERAAGPATNRCPVCQAPRLGGRFCAECGAALPSLTPHSGIPVVQFTVSPPSLNVPTQQDLSLMVARASTRQQPKAGPLSTLPFCGRDALLDALQALEGGVTLIVGEAGSGKTALVRAAMERRKSAGRRTIGVEAEGPGVVAPLSPMRRAIGAVLGLGEIADEDAIAAALGPHVEDHAGIAILFGCERGRSRLPLDARRRECRAAILSVLRRSDVDLVLDDLHLYDWVSRGLVAELVAAPSKITILCTASDASALPIGTAEVIQLEPLSALALSQLGVPEDIVARSGGLPFIVATELRAAAEGARNGSTEARLERLSESARRIAHLLAVAGAPLSHHIISLGIGLPAERVDAGLQELVARGYILPGLAYRLTSPTLRREIYEIIDLDRRHSLHALLAALLELAQSDVHTVAYHALLAGDYEPQALPELTDGPMMSPLDGVAALERAGVSARAHFDDAGASRTLRAAMERCRTVYLLGASDEAQPLLVRIALALGVTLRYQGDLSAAEVVLREATQLAQERKDHRAVAEARRALARVYALSGRTERAREEINHALKTSLSLGDPELMCECYLELGDLVAALSSPEAAAEELEEGLLLVTQGDGAAVVSGPEALPRLLVRLAALRLQLGAREKATRLVGHAARLVDTSPNEVARARIRALGAQVMHAAGLHEEAARLRRLAVADLRTLGDRQSTAEQLLVLAAEDPGLESDRRAMLAEAELLSGQVSWTDGAQQSRDRAAKIA
ncbi:MAG: protein kinase [Polyangia bacterium]